VHHNAHALTRAPSLPHSLSLDGDSETRIVDPLGRQEGRRYDEGFVGSGVGIQERLGIGGCTEVAQGLSAVDTVWFVQ